jgi:hypothetical protein
MVLVSATCVFKFIAPAAGQQLSREASLCTPVHPAAVRLVKDPPGPVSTQIRQVANIKRTSHIRLALRIKGASSVSNPLSGIYTCAAVRRLSLNVSEAAELA